MAASSEKARPAAPRRPGPALRNNAWKILGPGGGGTTMRPTISPLDPRIVVESCDMTGGYITTDGAQSWRMFNLRAGFSAFAFDPNNPAVLYAGNTGLWRSQDTGKTWTLLFPDPTKHTVEHLRGDHGEMRLTSDDPAYPADSQGIQAIAVAPGDSRHLTIVVSRSGQPARLLTSTDRGVTWTPQPDFTANAISSLTALKTNTGSVLYAVGMSGVYRGLNGHWEHLAGPAGARIFGASVGVSKESGQPLIYVTASAAWQGTHLEGGIYVSDDEGRTWRAATSGLTDSLFQPGESRPPRFQAVACSAQDASTAYVGFRGMRTGEGRANLYSGIAKTTDSGHHWSIVHQESDHPSANLEGSWIEARAQEGSTSIWFDAPYSLGVAPTDPDVCYATDLFRTYHTADGGKSWEEVNSVRVGPDRWTTRGLDVTTCYGVHFDPFDPHHLYISYTDIGLFQSTDDGASWTSMTEGIPDRWRNTTYWVAFDPQVRGLLWGAFSGTHDLPRPKMWRSRDPDDFEGGVAISRDGGQHWEPSNTGMPETAVTHILLDPTSPVGKRTLYACGFGKGVYKSTDNGQTWALKNQGIPQEQPFAWRLTRAEDGMLYLVIARRSEDGSIGTEDDGALYRSTDGAEHWERMALPSGVNGPTGLTLGPAHRLYLTAWGRMAPGGDTGGGVYVSDDAGQSWKPLFTGSQHVYDLTLDPQHPQMLTICGFDAAAYRSTDSGQTWKRIPGYDFKWGHRVILDPIHPDKIYITTFGGSLWHGPAAGDTHARADILTPILQAP